MSKYIVEVKGELPTYGALRNAKPLVTCGECVNARDTEGDAKPYDCVMHEMLVNGNFFCGFGERREDE